MVVAILHDTCYLFRLIVRQTAEHNVEGRVHLVIILLKTLVQLIDVAQPFETFRTVFDLAVGEITSHHIARRRFFRQLLIKHHVSRVIADKQHRTVVHSLQSLIDDHASLYDSQYQQRGKQQTCKDDHELEETATVAYQPEEQEHRHRLSQRQS